MHIQQRHCLPLLKFPNSILTFPRHVLQYVTCGNFKCPAGGQPSCFPRPEATIEHRILENWTGRVGQPFPLAAPSGHLHCARVQFTSFPTLSHCRQDSEWISCCVKQLMAMSSPAPVRPPPCALSGEQSRTQGAAFCSLVEPPACEFCSAPSFLL